MTTTKGGAEQLFLSFDEPEVVDEVHEKRTHRWRPPHVLTAIISGDRDSLEKYSERGNRSSKRDRKAAAAKGVATRRAKAAEQARQLRILEETKAAGEILLAAREVLMITFLDIVRYHRLHYRYARAHARRNRRGASHD